MGEVARCLHSLGRARLFNRDHDGQVAIVARFFVSVYVMRISKREGDANKCLECMQLFAISASTKLKVFHPVIADIIDIIRNKFWDYRFNRRLRC